jgi:arylsulfatase A-like enzyme
MSVLQYELRRLGIEKNTVIIFTSDNGSRGTNGGSNAPLRGAKATTWEGGQRVPCIMYWPGVIQPGQVCNEVACSLDFLPTFAGFAGAKAPGDRIIDGRDISDLVFGASGAKSPHEAFFYFWKDHLEAVRSGRWKLHVAKRKDEMLELYDLENDISETCNVAEQHPEIVAALLAKLEECREDLGDARVGASGSNCRPAGRVVNPKPLTLDAAGEYPLISAEYDLPDAG